MLYPACTTLRFFWDQGVNPKKSEEKKVDIAIKSVSQSTKLQVLLQVLHSPVYIHVSVILNRYVTMQWFSLHHNIRYRISTNYKLANTGETGKQISD